MLQTEPFWSVSIPAAFPLALSEGVSPAVVPHDPNLRRGRAAKELAMMAPNTGHLRITLIQQYGDLNDGTSRRS